MSEYTYGTDAQKNEQTSTLPQAREAAVGGSSAEAVQDCARRGVGPNDMSRQRTGRLDHGVLGLRRE